MKCWCAQLKPPCVIVVYYVLPAIRAFIAQNLVKGNLSQLDIAIKMGVTPAAITHYIKGKRGSSLVKKISQSERAVKTILELAECLKREETPIDVILSKTCEACRAIRSERLICDIHQAKMQALKKCGCNLCEM
jgi:predicted transcriptional regulator